MFKEFKEFAVKGNMIDLAVGVVIGAAFGAIVKSLVDDVIMPPLGLITGNVDFKKIFLVLKWGAIKPGPYESFRESTDAGAVLIKYGTFANTIVSFLIIAFSVFMLVKQINRLQKSAPVSTPPSTPDQKLLTEIRDILKDKN
jgi:large conductance mechanosensitive channel